jgi:transcriptional coactivator p15 (PC4)
LAGEQMGEAHSSSTSKTGKKEVHVLVGKIARNSKHRIMVTIEDQKGAKVVDLRVYQIINDGELSPTPEGISLVPENLNAVVELLRDAQKKLMVE